MSTHNTVSGLDIDLGVNENLDNIFISDSFLVVTTSDAKGAPNQGSSLTKVAPLDNIAALAQDTQALQANINSRWIPLNLGAKATAIESLFTLLFVGVENGEIHTFSFANMQNVKKKLHAAVP
jgi:hypothetical protein